ncbi:MAG: DUF2207 domain-containing protein [Blautia sp.]|nr:DUF2207 domain-containing protein [Blautia sp.]
MELRNMPSVSGRPLRKRAWLFPAFLLILAGIFFGRLDPAAAATRANYDGNMRTSRFSTEIQVLRDCSYYVTETIDVEMLEPRHGIYRYIPDRGSVVGYSGSGEARSVFFSSDIILESCSEEVSTEQEYGNFCIRMGSEDQTVYGRHTYKFSYHMKLHVDDPGFSAAYFNLFPTEWRNEIPAGSSFSVQFFSDFDPDELRLYYGEYGQNKDARDLFDLSVKGKKLVGKLKKDLAFGQGVTMYLSLPEGYYQKISTFSGLKRILAAVGIAVSLLVLILFLLFGREEGLIPAIQFQPPDGLDSAAAGYIIDGSAEDRDILSLIIYWADQGYLTIEEAQEGELILHRTGKSFPQTMPMYARNFYDNLFAGNRDDCELSSLEETSYAAIHSSRELVKAFVDVKGGLYTKSSVICQVAGLFLTGLLPLAYLGTLVVWAYLPPSMGILNVISILLFMVGGLGLVWTNVTWAGRSIAGRTVKLIGALALCAAGLLGIGGVNLFLIGKGWCPVLYLPLAIILAGMVWSLAFSVFMRKRTDQARKWLEHLLGLKDFIATAELDRMKMLAQDNPEWFYHILPYAYVFGLSDVFARKLEKLAVAPPRWYVCGYDPGYHSWNYHTFHHSFANGMGKAAVKLTTPPPQQASGTSKSFGGGFGSGHGGGGFSGGGFGGGGGGSW